MKTLPALTTEALWKVQGRALTDTDAAEQCALRAAHELATWSGAADSYIRRLMNAYLNGLHGEPDRYRHNRGANFAARLRSAYRNGARLRVELLAARAAAVQHAAGELGIA